MRIDLQQPVRSQRTEGPLDRCFYNCSCFCCRQGCCIIHCSCCCCCSEGCILFTSPCKMNLLWPRKSNGWKRNIGLTQLRTVLEKLVRWIIIRATSLVLWLQTLMTSHIILHEISQPITVGNGLTHVKAPVLAAVPRTATSKCDVMLNELCGHTVYDITSDQQVKTNNLCKMFYSNRKRQQRRPGRRRRRRRRNNDNGNKQQQKHQQHHIFQLGMQPVIAVAMPVSGLPIPVVPPKLWGANLNAHISQWPISATIRQCPKFKRTRANLVWLLIGLVWFEIKLIHCNALTSSYMSNLVIQKGCTLCQLEEGTFYNDKDNPHTIYNKYNNNNYFYKIKSNRNHNINNIATSDRIRLELIKRQILTKLGLTQKPNVSHPLPMQFIWETIYRAEGGTVAKEALINGRSEPRTMSKLNIFPTKNKNSRPSAQSALSSRTAATHSAEDTLFFQQKLKYTMVDKSASGELVINRAAPRANHQLSRVEIKKVENGEEPGEARSKIRGRIRPHSHSQSHSKKQRNTESGVEISNSNSSSNIINNSYNNNNSNRKSNKPNPYSKPTYPIDINRSSDSNTNSGINDDIAPNDHAYFHDYSLQIYGKSQKAEVDLHQDIDWTSSKIVTSGTKVDATMREKDAKVFEREDFIENTQEIITFAEEGTKYREHSIVEFSPQRSRTLNQKISIRSAEIHIRIDKHYESYQIDPTFQMSDQTKFTLNTKRKAYSDVTRRRIKIWVFQLTSGINITDQVIDQAFLFRASFEVDTMHLGWQKFDFTETIRDWYNDASIYNSNLRLLIDCTGCSNQYSLQLFNLSAQNGGKSKTDNRHVNPNRPFLVLHTELRKPRRVRRRAVDCGGARNGQCCKESFYVSFKALGWDDWIIAPRGYFANYCRGECTSPFRTPDTFQTLHAHFIEEYRKMGLLNGMTPCCAPIKFSSMSLIYYGDDGIIKRDLPKMVVDECGCP